MISLGICTFPAVFIFESYNIVLAQIIAALHFYDMDGLVSGVFDSVYSTDRNVR